MSALAKRSDILPISLPPRGLSRTEAAAYIGVSPTLFDEMVRDGRMPRPKQVNARTVWDRKRVDLAFDALEEQIVGPGDGDAPPKIHFAV